MARRAPAWEAALRVAADDLTGEELQAYRRLGWMPVERSGGDAPAAGNRAPATAAAEGTRRSMTGLELHLDGPAGVRTG